MILILMYQTLIQSTVPSSLPKRFIGKGYGGWFDIAFPAVVRAGIWNPFIVLAIALQLFTKDTVGSLTFTN